MKNNSKPQNTIIVENMMKNQWISVSHIFSEKPTSKNIILHRRGVLPARTEFWPSLPWPALVEKAWLIIEWV